jgi:LPXTG-motif cell wall-anchored protein
MLSAIGLGWIVGAPIDVHSWPKGSEGAMIAALLGFWIAAPIALIAGGVVVFRRRKD